MEVPERVATAFLLPLYVERIFKPGAKMSTHFPKLEK